MHHFEGIGETEADILVVEQSPVVNLVAVGYSDGTIQMVDLLYDEVRFTFKQGSAEEEPEPVTSMSFL